MEEKRKVVLVTGSSRGIGASIIKEFAKNNCDVIINYFSSEDEAIKLKNNVENTYHVKAYTYNCDVSNEDKVIKMVNDIVNLFGTIDYLINNAGIAIDTTIEDKTINIFKKTIDVNLIGTFLLCKYVGKVMMNNKSGRIVNISSTNGIDTYYPFSMDYDASKAGVISLTHNFATLYAPYINVNSVAPGWVNTEMNKQLDNDFKRKEENKILMGRFCEPDEIAKVVYFLCSDQANYINNTIIRVDGGFKC